VSAEADTLHVYITREVGEGDYWRRPFQSPPE